MRRFLKAKVAVPALLAGCMVLGQAAWAQTPAAAAGSGSVTARTAQLNRIFSDYWEDQLKHQPEFASVLGDKRYDDQLSDLSVAAINADLARGAAYIQRLSEVDTTGLPEQTRLSAELLLRTLIEAQEGARYKEWEMPLNQFNGVHTALPMLVAQLSFDTIKDYDDYVSRLKKIPTQVLAG